MENQFLRFTHPIAAHHSLSVAAEEWELVETAVPMIDEIPVRESLFAVANGFVGIRGYSEERYDPVPCRSPRAKVVNFSTNATGPTTTVRGVYLNGLHGERLLNHDRSFSIGTCEREAFLVRAPDSGIIETTIAGQAITTENTFLKEYRRVLDLSTGELRRRFTQTISVRAHSLSDSPPLPTSPSLSHSEMVEVTVNCSRFASITHRNVLLFKYQIVVKSAANVDALVHSAIRIDQTYSTLEKTLSMETGLGVQSTVVSRVDSTGKDVTIACVERCQIATPTLPAMTTSPPEMGSSLNPSFSATQMNALGPGYNQSSNLLPQLLKDEFGIAAQYAVVAGDSSVITLYKYVAYLSGCHDELHDAEDLAIQAANEAAAIGYDALLARQREVYQEFWEAAGVQLNTGDPQVQGTLRYNLLQLFMSAGRDKGHGFPARGLTGEMFGGLQSWEVELFVIPFLTHSCPHIARSLLQFRVDTLNEAIERAHELQLKRGALFPWRTVNGRENSPCISFALQLHVNADIAHATLQYYEATLDEEFMLQGGIELVWQTALMWLHWGTWDKQMFHLRSVTGPDDYNVLVDDNYFTNLMAQQHLKFAIDLFETFSVSHSSDVKLIMEKCSLNIEDIAEFSRAAQKMSFPYDGLRRIHLQDEGFQRKRRWELPVRQSPSLPTLARIGAHVPRAPHLLIEMHNPMAVLRHRVCKLADVVLGMVLQPHKFTRDEKAANFEYYEGLTTLDSQLTVSIFSIVAAELQQRDKAIEYFNRALFVDTKNVIGNTSGGLHSPCAGGSWLALVFGFGGFKVVDGIPHFNPWIPDPWEAFSFHVRHRGVVIQVVVTKRDVTYRVTGNGKIMLIHSHSTRVHLGPNKSVSIKYHRDLRTYDFDAVVFDSDAIIYCVEEDHFEAWRRVLDPFLEQHEGSNYKPFNHDTYLAYLQHHPLQQNKRHLGLQKLLAKRGIDIPVGVSSEPPGPQSMCGLISQKLEMFREIVQKKGVSVNTEVIQFISDLRRNGISVGCISSSKNGLWMVHQVPNLRSLFDVFFDANDFDSMNLRWRPELDFFAHCTKRLQTTPDRTIVVLSSIDGFSVSSLQQYWMVITAGVEDEDDVMRARAEQVRVAVVPRLAGLTAEGVEAMCAKMMRPMESPASGEYPIEPSTIQSLMS